MYISAFRKETDTRGRTKAISQRYVLTRVLKKKMQKELVPVVFQIKYKMGQQSSDLMALDSSWFGKCLNCHKRVEVMQW